MLSLLFGDGKIGVHKLRGVDGGILNGICFTHYAGKHEVGEPGNSGAKTLEELGPSVRMEFSNPQSVQVLIDALEDIRDSLCKVA